MNFYYFRGGNHILNNRIEKLENSGFKGVLFKYAPWDGDYITQIARDIKESQKIIYMVAIRPHAVSPQFLSMMNHSVKNIMKDRLQFNLISGHTKTDEKNIGGILSEVNDNSTHIERSNFLIKYMEELSKMKENKTYFSSPDFFVTATNKYVFNAAKRLNQKVIIPYREYKQGYWTKYYNYKDWGQNTHEEGGYSYDSKINLEDMEVMISLAPVVRETKEELKKVSRKKETDDTEYFTYEEFNQFIENLKNKGIKYLMLHPFPFQEEDHILNYVKYYTLNL